MSGWFVYDREKRRHPALSRRKRSLHSWARACSGRVSRASKDKRKPGGSAGNRLGAVYVARDDLAEMIKIGHSRLPTLRLRQLHTRRPLKSQTRKWPCLLREASLLPAVPRM